MGNTASHTAKVTSCFSDSSSINAETQYPQVTPYHLDQIKEQLSDTISQITFEDFRKEFARLQREDRYPLKDTSPLRCKSWLDVISSINHPPGIHVPRKVRLLQTLKNIGLINEGGTPNSLHKEFCNAIKIRDSELKDPEYCNGRRSRNPTIK